MVFYNQLQFTESMLGAESRRIPEMEQASVSFQL